MKIKDIVKDGLFSDGDWVESKDQDQNGDIRLIQLADIGDGKFIDKSNRFMNRETAKRLKCTYLKKNDILIARMPDPVGRSCLFPFSENEKYVTVVDVCVLRPDDSVDASYLMHIINAPTSRHEINRQVTGTTRKRITRRRIGELEIPLPPLSTQKRIAQILNQADFLRKITQEIIEQYNKLEQSIFLDMFGDPVTNPKGWQNIALGKICGVGSSKRVFVDELVEQGIPFYRGTEIGQLGEGVSITPSLFITNEHYEELKKHAGIPQIGDLLLPSICPDGRIWEVQEDEPFYFKDGRVLWIKVEKDKIVSVYLRKLLKTIFFINYSKIASGTTFAELKIIALKNLKILLPPMELQNKFAEKIQSIEKQKELAEESFKQSEDLFDALLQKAFKGELVT